MALPSSGQISMNDIRIELGVPSQSPFSLNTARQGGYVQINPFSPSIPPSSGPVSLASWYNYCQNCGYYTWTLGYDVYTPSAACSDTTKNTYYTTTTPLGIGVSIYAANGGYENSGSYSDGTNWWWQQGGSGGIAETGACGGGGNCLEYEITNFTEGAIGISYYNCSGAYIMDSIGSGNNLVFCANTIYGPIDSGGGTLSTIGGCGVDY